jgi:cell division protein FtsQ
MTQTVRAARIEGQRRSRLPWLLWALVVVVVIAWWVLYQSRWFLIEDVKVTGTKRLTVAAVLDQAQVRVGQPLMGADPHAVHNRIVKLEVVRQVRVERGWPHTLLIAVSERKPIAVVPADGSYIWVDEQGHIAGKSAGRPPHKIVVRAKPETPAIRAALDVYAGLPHTWKPLSLSAKTQDSVVVQMHHNIWITFGSSDDLEIKAKVAGTLLAKVARNKMINVSAPYNPTVRPAGLP